MVIEINKRYHGEKYMAIYNNNGKYLFMVRSSSKSLTKAIEDISISKQRKKSIIIRYEGVNNDAMPLIVDALGEMNQGNKRDLEHLLSQ